MDTKRKEQLQRTLVFTGLGLLFTLSIWFIFRPSADEQSAAEQGLNKDVPQASLDELPTSKLKAYELGRDEEAEGRKNQLLGTLADYFNREERGESRTGTERGSPRCYRPVDRQVRGDRPRVGIVLRPARRGRRRRQT